MKFIAFHSALKERRAASKLMAVGCSSCKASRHLRAFSKALSSAQEEKTSLRGSCSARRHSPAFSHLKRRSCERLHVKSSRRHLTYV